MTEILMKSLDYFFSAEDVRNSFFFNLLSHSISAAESLESDI